MSAIRPMEATDLADVVAVHRAAFPNHFMTKMGPSFLGFYYGRCLRFGGGIARVWLDERGVVQGFVAGFTEPDRFYAELSAARWRAAVPVLAGVLQRPSVLKRLLHNLTHARAEHRAIADAELSSIGVRMQGKGIGADLLDSFMAAADEAGCTSVSLTTDAEDNDAVNRFYLTRGFELVATRDSGGRSMNVFKIEIDEGVKRR